jgi:hypothetical protein
LARILSQIPQVSSAAYAGIKQRWLLVESTARKEADLKHLEQKIQQHLEEAQKQLAHFNPRASMDSTVSRCSLSKILFIGLTNLRNVGLFLLLYNYSITEIEILRSLQHLLGSKPGSTKKKTGDRS